MKALNKERENYHQLTLWARILPPQVFNPINLLYWGDSLKINKLAFQVQGIWLWRKMILKMHWWEFNKLFKIILKGIWQIMKALVIMLNRELKPLKELFKKNKLTLISVFNVWSWLQKRNYINKLKIALWKSSVKISWKECRLQFVIICLLRQLKIIKINYCHLN